MFALRSKAVDDCRLYLFEIWKGKNSLRSFLFRRALAFWAASCAAVCQDALESSTLRRHSLAIIQRLAVKIRELPDDAYRNHRTFRPMPDQ